MSPTEPIAAITENGRGIGFISTSQAASALGVSVSTIKRWVDEGILPAQKTTGKHRKLLVNDLLRLVRAGHLPQADLAPLFSTPLSRSADPGTLLPRLQAAYRSHDMKLLGQIIHGAYRGGIPIEMIGDRLVAPLMHEIGHDWEEGRAEVMHEHRASQACLAAMYELESRIRGTETKERPVATGGAPENDHCQLASQLAKLTLLDDGWEAINLGPHCPIAALRTALHELKPRLIWLSATFITDPESFIPDFNQFFHEAEEQGVAVAVGGQALTPELRRRLHYNSFGDGFAHLAAFARTLYRRPFPPRARHESD